jgi:hypothetical protein
VSTASIAYTRITPLQSQKTVNMTLPTDGDFYFFVSGRLRMVPFHGLPFCLQFEMMDPGFIFCNRIG